MTEGVKKKRWMPVLLSVSLALNLAVVAAFTGAALRHKGGGKMRPPVGSSGAIYMQALPEQMRREMHQKLGKRGGRKRVDPAAMITVLRQNPFDPAAAGAVLNTERSAGMAQIEAMSASWLEGVSAMSEQERHAYADRLEELSEKRKMRWKEWQGKERHGN
ncbi:MAG: periplasmic heavy metal sensor [Sulfitobacter sp.]